MRSSFTFTMKKISNFRHIISSFNIAILIRSNTICYVVYIIIKDFMCTRMSLGPDPAEQDIVIKK